MIRILLIEDNEDHAELIQRSLVKGFGKVKLQIAISAKEAYRELERKTYDLILSDYYLPEIDGDNHIRELNRRAPSIPLVIITGQGDEKVAAKSIQSGAEDYIVKTREALEALPTILKRAIVKHRSHLKNKRKEMRRHLDDQKQHAKKVLGEMEAIDRRVKKLKNGKALKTSNVEVDHDGSALEHLTQQIESLKSFVKNMFFKK